MTSTQEQTDHDTEQEMPRRRPSLWGVFLTAVQFLTRVPVPGSEQHDASSYKDALRRGVVFFPLVGGFVATVSALTCWVAITAGLSPLVSVLLALAAEALLTGAFHEDALADTCDAFGGGWTREQVLRIMKDSRLGTYGTIGLVLGVGIRSTVTADLFARGILLGAFTMVAAAALGRLAIVALMASTPPITDRDSHAKDISEQQTWRTVWSASVIAMPLWIGWVIVIPGHAIAGVLATGLFVAWYRRYVLRRLGGTTGDTLGCSAYVAQLVLLVVTAVGR